MQVWREIDNLKIPCGITIPWMTRGAIWGIKVRRAAGEVRYQQVGEGLISAAAIGSASNRRINPRWYPRFISAPSILIRMDDDQAGAGAAKQIAGLSQAARCVQVPVGKDVNEFYQLAGHDAVSEWIRGLVG